MEGQIRRLFQMEDGTPLTFAIHEDVPQHDRLREMITVGYNSAWIIYLSLISNR